MIFAYVALLTLHKCLYANTFAVPSSFLKKHKQKKKKQPCYQVNVISNLPGHYSYPNSMAPRDPALLGMANPSVGGLNLGCGLSGLGSLTE